MFDLQKEYKDKLEELAQQIQESEELSAYLEEEEEDDYTNLKEKFEPHLAVLHNEVAKNNPLQLIALEKLMLDDRFEGLFLPKLLGYSVLRGELNDHLKYVRPQEHFKAVLMTICNSANFDILKRRIGQSIQMGFAFSSDIWITNLINEIDNRRVRHYLMGHKLPKYRDVKQRQQGLLRYQRQFVHDNYQTADFPSNATELKVFFSSLKNFLIVRINNKELDNSSLIQPLMDFVENKDLQGSEEHLQLMGLVAGYFELSDKDHKKLAKIFNGQRKDLPEFSEKFLSFVLELHKSAAIDLKPDADNRVSSVVDKTIDDDLTVYYELMDMIQDKGYISEEVQAAVKSFYDKHEGLSLVNECVRSTIYDCFVRFIDNLESEAYTDFMDISKHFPVYMETFVNQKFNQKLEDLSMKYVRKLLKRFTDKRGKDYQDIKKFVSTVFVDLSFQTEKEVVELFKTRRKRKKKEA
ncbi:MAG: hypothetical protein DWQ02_19975 [Bacteroidetes bacterium]|nr:MAG: hypothetical protein DWQ02_19975 [Bacteroidota bacterium]